MIFLYGLNSTPFVSSICIIRWLLSLISSWKPFMIS